MQGPCGSAKPVVALGGGVVRCVACSAALASLPACLRLQGPCPHTKLLASVACGSLSSERGVSRAERTARAEWRDEKRVGGAEETEAAETSLA